ncbi:MAG: DUF2339 domain-containing protein [Thermoleophilia bacterium]|nr:DUF2339 domain-containing protein [Thermoleophilia bacterium]
MTENNLSARLDRLERHLAHIQSELADVRRLATAEAAVTAKAPEPAPPPPVRPEAPAPPQPAVPLLDRAWRDLERARYESALRLAADVLEEAEERGDEASAAEVAAFAAAAVEVAPPPLRRAARELAARAGAGPARAEQIFEPPAPRGPSAAERLAGFVRSELTGPRAFALAGGVVTLLGVVFLFVLAANRGWIGPIARLSIGGAASLAVFSAGVALRARFGRLQSSLAAVGTGVAGGYATVAAATILYDLLSRPAALLVAAGIATAGAALGLRWSSQVLAGLSLVGAAVAPALVALDTEITATGTGFALIVLAVALLAAPPRGWSWLDISVGSVVLAQVAWLTAASPAGDAGALGVAAAGSLVLLAGGAARQARFRAEGLDPRAAILVVMGGTLAFGTLSGLLPDGRDAGAALAAAAAVYGASALALGRRWPDLGWTAGIVALFLVGVATADVFAGRSLTVAWAVEAAALAAVARRLLEPRFQAAGLTYLAAGITHALVIDLAAGGPANDIPTSAAPGMLALAGAAVVGGTLALERRGNRRAVGLLAALERVWDELMEARGSLRLLLWTVAVGATALGSAALASGRTLTLTWAAAAAVLACLAFAFGERRLQGAGLAFLGLAAVHAWAVEAPLSTLALPREASALGPAPSLAALAGAAAALAATTRFLERGLLGPLAGGELLLDALRTAGRGLRALLVVAAVWLVSWTASLLLVELAYDPGQAGATALWAAVGSAALVLASRRRSPGLLLAATPVVFAFGKATGFDWGELGTGSAAAALLAAALGVVLAGHLARYALADDPAPLGALALLTGITAGSSAFVAIDRLAPDAPRAVGAWGLLVALTFAALAAPPFAAWRRGGSEPWLRNLATIQWLLALVALGAAQVLLLDSSSPGLVGVWALTAALVATAAGPAGEPRLWLAGLAASALAALVCLAAVTEPSSLFVAEARPGAGLWALAAGVGSLAWIAARAPAALWPMRSWPALGAVCLTLFGLSLGVLELAQRISGASVATDFQRGHTGVSALWGALALGLFVTGLVRSERVPQRIGLTLFGLAFAKLFLYDLSSLSSVTRALSFLAVGAILLTAAFFVERLVPDTSDAPAGTRPAG